MATSHVLGQSFFARPTCTVAREMLGKYLVRKMQGKEYVYMITEVEAYDGPHDLASHAAKGRTKRTEVMFGPAGHWYVYLCYGIHWMLNIVTGPDGHPAAILIRGVEGVKGPGRVTKKLAIDKRLNAKVAHPTSGLWVEDRGVDIPRSKIKCTPRIGVSYAKEWAQTPLRYVIHTDA